MLLALFICWYVSSGMLTTFSCWLLYQGDPTSPWYTRPLLSALAQLFLWPIVLSVATIAIIVSTKRHNK